MTNVDISSPICKGKSQNYKNIYKFKKTKLPR